jgi:hypothetical protein
MKRAVSLADIAWHVDADWADAQVPGWLSRNCQHEGGALNKLAGCAVHGPYAVANSTLRLGRMADPTRRFGRVWHHRIHAERVPPTTAEAGATTYVGSATPPRYDGAFGNGIRAELLVAGSANGKGITRGETCWLAVSICCVDGQSSTLDEQLLWQIKSEGHGHPMFQLAWSGGRLRAFLNYNTNAGLPFATNAGCVWVAPWSEPGLSRKWHDYVMQLRVVEPGAGDSMLKLWRDGALLFDYAGKLGSASWPTDPYNCRLGWYHWINNNNGASGRWDVPGSSRAMHTHGYRMIRDQTGVYDEPAIRALLAPVSQLVAP